MCAEVRDRLPLIESGGFRPPRIPLTSRKGKRGTSAQALAADVAKIARDVIAYDPSGITLQVDHAKGNDLPTIHLALSTPHSML